VTAASQGALIASMDSGGTILVRDLKNNADIVNTITISRSFETGYLLFNALLKTELFVFFNNELEVYDSDGRVIQRTEFDHNVVYAT
jgi:hypothetical protein